MQEEIFAPLDLLNADGEIAEPGWARRPLYRYNRDQVRAGWHRRKEWDYYWALTPRFGVTVTVADLGYVGLVTATTIDFEKRQEVTEPLTRYLTKGSLGLPVSSQSGDIDVTVPPNVELKIRRTPGGREIEISWPSFDQDKGLYGKLALGHPAGHESMVIATPFAEGRRLFFLNEKLTGLPVRGNIRYGRAKWAFGGEHAFGGLDWGRGVWPYRCQWYWGTAAGRVDGHTLAFNVGYGFGDTSAASENLIFYDGVGHKLDEITFELDPSDFMKPWRFNSNDERLVMTMKPLVERASDTNLLVARSRQNQIFGRFSGRAVLDDGAVIRFDDLLGFAEEVHNRW